MHGPVRARTLAGMETWQQPFIGSEALADGRVSRHGLRTRYRAELPGVYVPKRAALPLAHRISAAWLWSGRAATIAGLAASALHGSKWVDGDVPIRKGIDAVFSPGHTPGMQGVLVETKEGKYCIGSDTFPLFENYEKAIPAGIHVDLNEWYATYEKTKTICDHILPGHDIRVLDRSVYG